MCRTVSQFVVLLCLLATFQAIEGQQRISQIKCDQYRKREHSCIPHPRFQGRPVALGGERTRPNEFPHHALLGWKADGKYIFHCGGSLISEYYVLTALRCFLSIYNPEIVRLGEVDLANEFDSQLDLEIENVTKPILEHGTDEAIALIRLVKEVIFSDFIRPACLWDSSELNFTSVIATGFGLRRFYPWIFPGGTMSNKLRKVHLNEAKSLRGWLSSELRYQSQEGGRDFCQGDPGGPIQVLMNSADCTFFVVGVAPNHINCNLDNWPIEYTRVASYIAWIESIVWPLFQGNVTTTTDIYSERLIFH